MKIGNCWEFRKCGKEKKEDHAGAGECPAGTPVYGRVCYAVAGTIGNEGGGLNFVEKYKDCRKCDFFLKHAIKEKLSKKRMCWEVKKCGGEIGGASSEEQGICAAASPLEGRACWVVAGTFCSGKVQGSFAQKIDDCRRCEFFIMVKNEHVGAMSVAVKSVATI